MKKYLSVILTTVVMATSVYAVENDLIQNEAQSSTSNFVLSLNTINDVEEVLLTPSRETRGVKRRMQRANNMQPRELFQPIAASAAELQEEQPSVKRARTVGEDNQESDFSHSEYILDFTAANSGLAGDELNDLFSLLGSLVFAQQIPGYLEELGLNPTF